MFASDASLPRARGATHGLMLTHTSGVIAFGSTCLVLILAFYVWCAPQKDNNVGGKTVESIVQAISDR